MNVDRILSHLRLDRAEPSPAALHAFLVAWSERIPWESASRIARHTRPASPEQYARDPDAFFTDALERGLGGTCFESNTAAAALLAELGYDVTRHLCDMSKDHVDPHCALSVTLDGARYLADVGFPIPAAIPLSGEARTAMTMVYRYHVEPVAEQRWRIWRESGQFTGKCFVLKGDPVSPDALRNRLVRDHHDDGLFLDNVIIHRVVDGRMLRFDEVKGLIERTHGAETDVPWTDAQAADVPAAVADIFAADVGVIRAALERQKPA
ncbi:MAG: arylamine N-acetyltransferase [Chloroflexi bacterium]|nr:arylamine N-acetyltransferase [Chloroflexota bacterium]